MLLPETNIILYYKKISNSPVKMPQSNINKSFLMEEVKFFEVLVKKLINKNNSKYIIDTITDMLTVDYGYIVKKKEKLSEIKGISMKNRKIASNFLIETIH